MSLLLLLGAAEEEGMGFVHADNDGANIQALTGVSWGTAGAATVDGDIALLPWSFQNTQTPTDPTSDTFSLLADNSDGSARLRCLYRYCDATESGAISGWQNSGINRQTAVLFVIRGYQFISGFSVRLEDTTGTSHDNPAITTADGFAGNSPADGDTIIIITSTRDGATTVVTAPAGYAKQTGSEIGLAASGGTHTAVADDGLDDAVTLPHDPAAWTGFGASSGNAVTMTIALRPVSSGESFPIDQTDTAGLTDISVIEVVRAVAQTDSTGLTDAAVIDQAKVVTDSTGLTDSAALTVSWVQTDSAGLTDTSSIELSKLVTQTDLAGLTDSAGLAQAKTLTDSAGLTDAAALTQSKVLTDSAGLTDTSAVESGKALAQTDSTGLTDGQAISQTHVLTDSTGLTDAAGLTVSKVVTDSAGLTDAASVGILREQTTTDLVGLTDATTFTRSAVLSDLVGLADAVALSQLYILTESVGLTDSAEASNYFPITFRPNTGTTARPSSGTTPRPNNGITARP